MGASYVNEDRAAFSQMSSSSHVTNVLCHQRLNCSQRDIINILNLDALTEAHFKTPIIIKMSYSLHPVHSYGVEAEVDKVHHWKD